MHERNQIDHITNPLALFFNRFKRRWVPWLLLCRKQKANVNLPLKSLHMSWRHTSDVRGELLVSSNLHRPRLNQQRAIPVEFSTPKGQFHSPVLLGFTNFVGLVGQRIACKANQVSTRLSHKDFDHLSLLLAVLIVSVGSTVLSAFRVQDGKTDDGQAQQQYQALHVLLSRGLFLNIKILVRNLKCCQAFIDTITLLAKSGPDAGVNESPSRTRKTNV